MRQDLFSEAGGEARGELLRHVLDDDDAGSIGGHFFRGTAKGFGTAGGCDDDDDFFEKGEGMGVSSKEVPTSE
jgi:hypothetical protein